VGLRRTARTNACRGTGGLRTGEATVHLPDWFDWTWALARILDDAPLPNERVQVAQGCLTTASGGHAELVAARSCGGGRALTVSPGGDEAASFLARRFHLCLDAAAVEGALGATGIERLDSTRWCRRPAAAGLWPFTFVYLSGLPAHSEAMVTLFRDLGGAVGGLPCPPPSATVLEAGRARLASYGVAAHRADNLLALAKAFAQAPERYDDGALRALPADQALARLSELPHIGATRARAIATSALGHDDVLADLSRLDERLRLAVGLGWSQIRARAEAARPYRSVVGDTLLERIGAARAR